MAVKPGYKQTEAGCSPVEWEVTTLLALVKGKKELFDDGDWIESEHITSQGVRLVQTGNIGIGCFVEKEDRKYISEASFTSLRCKQLLTGDLLICRLADPAGRASVFPNIGERKVVTSVDVTICRPPVETVNRTYLANLFSTSEWFRKVSDRSGGTTHKRISRSALGRIPFELPPLPEQDAIATALSDVDALLGALERLIAKKRDLKQAAMQQLLTGQTRLPGFEGEWEMSRIGDVADTDPENLSSDTKTDFTFNYIALEDVDRGALRSYSRQFYATAPSRARRKLCENDVLVSTVRPNLQSHLLFCIESGSWVCSTGFCVVRCRPGVTHPGYLFNHLFANCVNRQIETLLTGSNYPAINSGDVRALEIPLPSYAEQAAIATVLSDMDAELAALEQRLAKTRALKQGMMQELLTGRTRLI